MFLAVKALPAAVVWANLGRYLAAVVVVRLAVGWVDCWRVSGGGSATGNAGPQAPSAGSLGHLLNGALQGSSIPEPEPAQEDQARILIQVMMNAGKSDGEVDRQEQQKIIATLGYDVSDEERKFVISEMKAPLDAQGFFNSIPQGAGPQVCVMSLLGIDLDTQAEAQYLNTLRKSVNMSEQEANAIHQKLGVPTLYSQAIRYTGY